VLADDGERAVSSRSLARVALARLARLRYEGFPDENGWVPPRGLREAGLGARYLGAFYTPGPRAVHGARRLRRRGEAARS
jgi:hypothetical protein